MPAWASTWLCQLAALVSAGVGTQRRDAGGGARRVDGDEQCMLGAREVERPRRLCASGSERGERDEGADGDVPPTHPASLGAPLASALVFYRNLPILQRVLTN